MITKSKLWKKINNLQLLWLRGRKVLKDSSETQLCPLAHKKFQRLRKVQGYHANIYLQGQ